MTVAPLPPGGGPGYPAHLDSERRRSDIQQMKLDPSFMDELHNRTSLAQVAGRKLSWDNRKSQPSKGDFWAPCPFHQEKTASFHVDDRKGFYYCFGCHAKGDAVSFVRETENVGFMEAIEILAREAGLEMPQRDPRARERADQRASLTDLMGEAEKFFRLCLRGGQGRAAREYLERRGLNEAAQDRWGLGFAPDSWQALWDHLTGKGAKAEELIACGLAKPSTRNGGRPYDVFRNRIMFPIRDPRGRVIAFGGRAMDPNDNAKYLNSPETQLFDKSRTLFNFGPAREASGKGQPIIVAEGYMDAIALAEAGFTGAVANLGTAVTEHHLDMLWRVTPEPVLAQDGDKAGLRSAYKVIDLVLPKLAVGKSVRFALLPDGQDPDELIKARGAKAMNDVILQAMPLVELLWQRETEGKSFDSPDRRAALDAGLKRATAQIQDQGLRYHYDQALREKMRDLFRPSRQGNWQPGQGRRKGSWKGAPAGATASVRASLLVSEDEMAMEYLREGVILASLYATPEVAEAFEPQLERMECRDPRHARLRDLLLSHAHEGPEQLRQEVARQIAADALDELMTRTHVALCPPVRHPGDAERARMTVAEELAKLQAARALRAEIAEAEEDILASEDEAMTWRLGEAARASSAATRSQQEDRAEYDLGENGARINRDERSALDALMQSIRFTKSRK